MIDYDCLYIILSTRQKSLNIFFAAKVSKEMIKKSIQMGCIPLIYFIHFLKHLLSGYWQPENKIISTANFIFNDLRFDKYLFQRHFCQKISNRMVFLVINLSLLKLFLNRMHQYFL